MKYFLFSNLLALFLILHINTCRANSLEDFTASTLDKIQIELGYTTGKYISINQDYLRLGIFNPFFISEDRSCFLDMQGYRFNEGKWAASMGLGLRQNITDFSAIGINAYYDYRRGCVFKHSFHQLGIGLEWLTECWGVQINGYLPLAKKKQAGCLRQFDQLGDGFIASSRTIEYAYRGFDAEIGAPLVSYCDFHLYGAVGPYYFFKSHQSHFWGGFGRLELDWKSLITLQLRISHDHKYSTNVQGVIQIFIPFDFFYCAKDENCHECQDLFFQPIRRNDMILTDHCCNWKWNWNDKN